MAINIQLRNDLSSVWAEVNPVLMEGELAIESDTRKIKIGDGTTVWAGLDYATQGERGRALEYNWRGTELGVRLEGGVDYEYVDLRDRTNTQEILDARGGAPSLADNLQRIESDQQLHNLDNGKSYNVVLQVNNGQPRLKMEEI